MSNYSDYSHIKAAPIRVLVVDDKELFREGLVSLLNRRQEIEVVGQAEDGFEALELARRLRPQVILMDVDMPGCNGVRATELIKAEPDGLKTSIIMLTISEEDKDLFSAIKGRGKRLSH